MATFNVATLRTNPRIIKITDEKWEGKDYDPDDTNQLEAPRLNTFIVDQIIFYNDLNLRDDILYNYFKEDFGQ
jgi:hypothetical protein